MWGLVWQGYNTGRRKGEESSGERWCEVRGRRRGGARDMKGKGTERREVVGGREEKKRGLWRRDTGVRRTSE